MKSHNRRIIQLAFTFLALVVITGCGGSGGGGDRGAIVTPPAGSGGARIAGTLVDTGGNPVSGAQVSLIGGGEAVTTDASGSFFLNAAADGTPVRFSAAKAGFLDGFYSVRVSTDTVSNGLHSATLTIAKMPAAADQATQAQITRADGSTEDVSPTAATDGGATYYQSTVTLTGDERSVNFTTPAASGARPSVSFQIGSADGSGANAAAVLGQTGVINASVSYGDPTDMDALATFPGDFSTIIDNGSGEEEMALITAGFTRITLTDANGQPITQFAGGQTAKITMTVPAEAVNPETGALVTPGDTIPVFVFNETTGQWIIERNADNSFKETTVQQDNDGNLFVEFETSHLTTFNLDWKSTRCPANTPKFNFVDTEGNPTANVTMYADTVGWYVYPRTVSDNWASFMNAPADLTWQVYAKKGDYISETVSIKDCKDTRTGSSEITLVVGVAPEPKCSSNTECDDSNPGTYDKCINPGKLYATCTNTNCTIQCDSSAACDDSKATTSDACVNGGTCQSYCTHAGCNSQCATDAQCEDENPDTLNVCMFAGTCNSDCQFPAAYCDLQLDKVNYLPGDTMTITLTARNDGSVPASCGVGAALKRAPKTQVWNSFDESLFITIQPGQSVTRTITKIVPAGWPGTDTNEGSDYDMFTMHQDGARWDSGDNFNIHISKTCVVACASDAACSAPTPYCSLPGTCGSVCSSDAPCTIKCSNDSQCDDSDALTLDVCDSPGTCDALCSRTACTPYCFSDADAVCDDSNDLTFNSCVNPGTCSAACAHSACTPICFNDEGCDDQDDMTTDTCSAPGTCGARCDIVPIVPRCTIDAECDDGSGLTTDFCANPGAAGAKCYNTTLEAVANPTEPVRVAGTAASALTCTATGEVDSLEGRCSAADSWETVASGSPLNCGYTAFSSYTPGCRLNNTLVVETSTPVKVSNKLPVVSITATPTFSPDVPLDVAFTAACNDADGSCVSYLWDFGDGSPTSSQQNPAHSFMATGTYTVLLTVTDNEGGVATKTVGISAGRGNEWITIPAGDFVMGCAAADPLCASYSNELPKHTVALSEYKIQKYEVTNAEYVLCWAASACTRPESVNSHTRTPYYGNAAYDNYPVISVNWNQASAYCAWIGGRLPTEAEWEKAARGPNPAEPIYPWGDGAANCTLMNYSGCTGDTDEVGSHPAGASTYGVMDLAGNVWEWVNDWYDGTYYTTGGPPWSDPQGPGSSTSLNGQVLRGGSFGDLAEDTRVSSRYHELYYIPDRSYNNVGFRCAQD